MPTIVDLLREMIYIRQSNTYNTIVWCRGNIESEGEKSRIICGIAFFELLSEVS